MLAGMDTPSPALHDLHDLYDPQRHEPLADIPWSQEAARAAIVRICSAAEAEFDAARGNWPMHPQDEPPTPGARSDGLYLGGAGVVWALRDLAAQGAVTLRRDYTPWITRYPERVREETAQETHGTGSFLCGEAGPLLLAWHATGRAAFAERLFDVVQANLHNTAQEPLWGNAGTMLAALPLARDARWQALLQQAVQALLDDMVVDPDNGCWTWQQQLYGRPGRHLGAAHGLAGNVYGAWRAAPAITGPAARTIVQRGVDTLAATALHARVVTPEGEVQVANWHVLTDRDRLEAGRARGYRPLVQDCHGAPGIASRLAEAPEMPVGLLRAAGEMTWQAGPLAKGASVCHGTAGSALACLKLWRRLADPLWLERARRLALHAAAQVDEARAHHGHGRHSLWTGDLGVACVLWACVQGTNEFPTLDGGPR